MVLLVLTRMLVKIIVMRMMRMVRMMVMMRMIGMMRMIRMMRMMRMLGMMRNLLKDCLRASTTLSVKSSTTLCAPLKKIMVIVILPRWPSWVGRPFYIDRCHCQNVKEDFLLSLVFPARGQHCVSILHTCKPANITRCCVKHTKVGKIMSCIKNKINQQPLRRKYFQEG